MKHRVFLGLPISEELQQEILDWEKRFLDLPVRWLKGKNLHITLVPPWYIQARTDADPTQINAELGEVKAALQKMAGFGEFKIKFSKVTFGPPASTRRANRGEAGESRRPRLIWAEGETPKELVDLQKKICEIFEKESEKRPLKLHLTIARFRPESFSSFPIKRLDEKVDWRDVIDRMVLFESRLSREGADYQILSEISL